MSGPGRGVVEVVGTVGPEGSQVFFLPILTVHVRQGSAHSIAALAYGKRRRHHTSAGRQKSMLSETEVGVAVGYNVERPV